MGVGVDGLGEAKDRPWPQWRRHACAQQPHPLRLPPFLPSLAAPTGCRLNGNGNRSLHDCSLPVLTGSMVSAAAPPEALDPCRQRLVSQHIHRISTHLCYLQTKNLL